MNEERIETKINKQKEDRKKVIPTMLIQKNK